MVLDPRLHIRVTASMPEHPKVETLGDKAFRCLIEAWCYCRRSGNDGLIPMRAWKKNWTPKARNEVIAAGLAHVEGDVVRMHDYLDHQPTAAALNSKLAARAEAGRRGGQKSGESRRAAAAARAAAKGEPPAPDPAAPGPVPDGPLSPAVEPSAWRMVKASLGAGHSQAVITDLSLRAGALLKEGVPEVDVRAALDMWAAKSGIGPGLLPSLVSDVVKARARPAQQTGNSGRLSAREQRLVDAELLKDSPDPAILRSAGIEPQPHLRAIPGGAP
ncbi:hypothetical protein [Nocardia sp. NPDC055049]